MDAPRKERWHRVGLTAILLLSGLLASTGSVWAGDEPPLGRIKVAFILNIARFVEWPPEAFQAHDSEFRLCLLDVHGLGEAVEAISGKYVGARALAVLPLAGLDQAAGCNLLIIPPQRLTALKAKLLVPPPALLTLTDLTDAEQSDTLHGIAMVALVRRDTRMGFEIHRERARAAGLKLSSELLKLGVILE